MEPMTIAIVIAIAPMAAILGIMLFSEWREPSNSGAGLLAVFIGFAGFVALLFFIREQSTDQRRESVAVVDSYLDALQSGEFDAAYSKLCSQAQERETLQEFVARQNAGPRLLYFEIETPTRNGSQPMQVPLPPPAPPVPAYPGIIEADLRFADGTRREERYEYHTGGPQCVAPERG